MAPLVFDGFRWSTIQRMVLMGVRWAQQTFWAIGERLVVLDVDYSKAPEWPWPSALEDVETLIRWLKEEWGDGVDEKRNGKAEMLKISPSLKQLKNEKGEFVHLDSSQMTISGFSSGGNLALVASSQPSTRGNFRAVVACYPGVKLTFAEDDTNDEERVRSHQEPTVVNIDGSGTAIKALLDGQSAEKGPPPSSTLPGTVVPSPDAVSKHDDGWEGHARFLEARVGQLLSALIGMSDPPFVAVH